MKTPPTTHPEYREHVLDTFLEGLLTGSFDRTHALRQIAVEKHREREGGNTLPSTSR